MLPHVGCAPSRLDSRLGCSRRSAIINPREQPKPACRAPLKCEWLKAAKRPLPPQQSPQTATGLQLNMTVDGTRSTASIWDIMYRRLPPPSRPNVHLISCSPDIIFARNETPCYRDVASKVVYEASEEKNCVTPASPRHPKSSSALKSVSPRPPQASPATRHTRHACVTIG